MKRKIHVYFVPGLAANSKIFEFINATKDSFEFHFLEWILPLSVDEPIESYARRMCEMIKHENPVLVGVSFGGVMVQEMSKVIQTKKVIIISSIKSRKELPLRLKLAQKTKAYKLFPARVIEHFEEYEHFFIGNYLQKRAELYKKYMSVRDANYLQWAIHNVLNWKQEFDLKYVIHIHGNKDEIFPHKHITRYIEVEGGTHIMILNKARVISQLLEEQCLSFTD